MSLHILILNIRLNFNPQSRDVPALARAARVVAPHFTFLKYLVGEIIRYSSFHNHRFQTQTIKMNLSLEGLKEQVSNLSLYDIKAGVRKVQNGKYSRYYVWSGRDAYTGYAAVMNYTEMEAKVREATNNEPWGSSSS